MRSVDPVAKYRYVKKKQNLWRLLLSRQYTEYRTANLLKPTKLTCFEYLYVLYLKSVFYISKKFPWMNMDSWLNDYLICARSTVLSIYFVWKVCGYRNGTELLIVPKIFLYCEKNGNKAVLWIRNDLFRIRIQL